MILGVRLDARPRVVGIGEGRPGRQRLEAGCRGLHRVEEGLPLAVAQDERDSPVAVVVLVTL